MAEQLSLDLSIGPSWRRADFFVSSTNALAVSALDMPDWPDGRLVITGPAGAGKTHLAHIFASESGAATLNGADLVAGLDVKRISKLTLAPLVIESMPTIAKHRKAEETALHLCNLAAANGQRLLVTGRPPPRDWGLTLPDLASRVAGSHHVSLPQPDDRLLAAVLAKLFHDRQLIPRPDVIPYLQANIPRSFQAAGRIVAMLDETALAEKREITRALAMRLVGSAKSRQ